MEKRIALTLESHQGYKRKIFLPEDRARKLVRHYLVYGEDFGLGYILASDLARFKSCGVLSYFTSYRQGVNIENGVVGDDYWKTLHYPENFIITIQ